jgi:hypothetical protein
VKNARAAFKWSFANEIDPKGWKVSHANMVSYRRSVPYTDVAVTGAVLVGSDDEEPLVPTHYDHFVKKLKCAGVLP